VDGREHRADAITRWSSQEWTDKSAFTGFDFTVGISVSSRSIDAEGIAT